MDGLAQYESVERQVYAAKEVQQFLKHDAVQKAFEATKTRIRKQWEQSDTPEEREACWYKLRAFQELIVELRATADRRPTLHQEKE